MQSVLQQDTKINIFPVPIQLRIQNFECARKINTDDRIKGEKLGKSKRQQSINAIGNENIENLFEIKNSLVRSKLEQNPGN